MTKKKTPDEWNQAYRAMLVEAADRQKRALEMHEDDRSFAYIAEKLGVGRERARQIVMRAKRIRANGGKPT